MKQQQLKCHKMIDLSTNLIDLCISKEKKSLAQEIQNIYFVYTLSLPSTEFGNRSVLQR